MNVSSAKMAAILARGRWVNVGQLYADILTDEDSSADINNTMRNNYTMCFIPPWALSETKTKTQWIKRFQQFIDQTDTQCQSGTYVGYKFKNAVRLLISQYT